MSRQIHSTWIVLVVAVATAIGCQPMQPMFFNEDGDLSHYMDVATALEEPDVDHVPLDEVTQTHAPLTLDTIDDYDRWYISLEEVLQTVLSNSQVMRTVGGRVVRPGYATSITERSSTALTNRLLNTGTPTTSYDPSIVESAYGVSTDSPLSGGVGVEAALSEFDARLDAGMFWEKQDRPQNVIIDATTSPFLVPTLQQDLGTFNAGITKTAANGSQFSFFNNTRYDLSNTPTRALPSAWYSDFTFSANQPLLQGAGAQYNRIAGPHTFNAYQQGFANQIDGVVIGRIRHDITLAEFEGSLIEVVQEAETAYWDLYFAFREMEANKEGMEYSRRVWEKKNIDVEKSSAADISRARAEYFRFRAEVESSLTNLMSFENRLRYLMGLAVADGRLLTPKDEPTTAKVAFDWCMVHPEAITRRVEVRKQKWTMKRREMELIASRNHLLPRLDAVGRYRFLGMGDDLIDNNGTGLPPQAEGSNAFDSLVGGEYQEWEMGLQLSMPLGFRQALTGVRHHELLLAREKALLDDLELEISHQLGEAYRILNTQHRLIQTNFNRRIAAEKEVEAMQTDEEGQASETRLEKVTLDSLLDSERRKVDAQIAYYRSLTDYNLAIMRMHYRKGSLLEYNNVYLNEGPWPKKAYFDALREARRRDGATFIDYGFTRPGVISQGPIEQNATGGVYDSIDGEVYEFSGENYYPADGEPELVPTPAADPMPETDAMELDVPQPMPEDSARRGKANGPLLQPASMANNSRARSQESKSHPYSGDNWKTARPGSVAAARTNGPARSTGVRQMNFESLSGQQRHESGKTQSAAGTSAAASGWQRSQR